MSGNTLADVRAAISTASDIAYNLEAAPSPDGVEELLDALRRALRSAGGLTPGGAGGGTGCREHPGGPVDPLHGDDEDPLPPGWGRCLLCNDRRRRANAGRRRAF
jgi:hypothetical protein